MYKQVKAMPRPWWLPLWKIYWNLRHRLTLKPPEANRVPDFALASTTGKPFRLYDALPNRTTLLWLTNFCESCLEKIPFLTELKETHGDRLNIFAISILRGDLETPYRMARQYSPPFPVLLDPNDWVENVLGLPHPDVACPLYNFLVIDGSGRIKYRAHLSAVSEQKVRDVIEKELDAITKG